MYNSGPYPLHCSRMRIRDTVHMLGTVNLQAKASDGNPLKFNLVANTGRPMPLEDYPHPVIIDLKGAEFEHAVTPIIMEHDPERRVGHTLSQKVDAVAGIIEAVGVKSSTTDFAMKFEQDLSANFPFQVSVGGKIVKAQFVPAGQKAKVNGQIFDGPVIVSRKTSIRELSVCVLGADSGTSVSIAATDRQSFIFTEEVSMEFEAFVASMGLKLETLDEATTGKIKAMWESKFKVPPPLPKKKPKADRDPDGDPLRRQRILAAKESHRIDTINAVAGRYPLTLTIKHKEKEMPLSKFKAGAIKNGMSSTDFELTLLRAHRPKHQGKTRVHVVPGVEDLGNDVIACSVLKAMGNVPFRTSTVDKDNPHVQQEEWGIETWYDQKVLEASDHRLLKGVSLHQVMDLMIHQQLGYQYTGRRGSHDHIACARKAYRKLHNNDGDIKAAGFTTLDISTIFEDVGNKLLWSGFNTIATVWQELVTTVNVSDFKTYNFYRMDTGGAYQKVGNDGELKHGKFTEEKFSVSADTYGKMVGLTRRDMINDDMGVFNRVMSGLGSEAARTIEEIVMVYFLGALGTMFTTGQSNKLEGTGYVLSAGTAALAAAEALFINQVNADKSPIGINADRILVGSNNKTYANNLYNQTTLVPTGTTNQRVFPNNEYVGTYRPIVTPYLNNTAIRQRVDDKNVGAVIPGQSSTGWFMLAPPNLPQGGMLLLALLNGRRQPYLDQAEAAFDVLGMLWRAYHDVGIGAGDPKLGVHVTGVAAVQ